MTNNLYTRTYRLGLDSLFVPNSSPFQINWECLKVSGQKFVQRMSLRPNVVDRGLMNSDEIAEQHKKNGWKHWKTDLWNKPLIYNYLKFLVWRNPLEVIFLQVFYLCQLFHKVSIWMPKRIHRMCQPYLHSRVFLVLEFFQLTQLPFFSYFSIWIDR